MNLLQSVVLSLEYLPIQTLFTEGQMNYKTTLLLRNELAIRSYILIVVIKIMNNWVLNNLSVKGMCFIQYKQLNCYFYQAKPVIPSSITFA